ncbi:hypothetical protein CCOS865_02965 [Pseudomonas reidholzensis]|uniref:Uncharacterized protein n=1 Tax=Pseudomonas reidholzensis TaxID=1785162 RepID=A0A383RWD2_9PSED|nr:hypothetical protein [Pseudomonas reidholzensis]SYX90698.1 hypothetical protein CCOS865_02965 [Pseudomonas reidholzensis]
MSHEQVIKQMREDLTRLGNEVRNGPQHETRSMLLSAAAGAVFALTVSWLAFKVLF